MTRSQTLSSTWSLAIAWLHEQRARERERRRASNVGPCPMLLYDVVCACRRRGDRAGHRGAPVPSTDRKFCGELTLARTSRGRGGSMQQAAFKVCRVACREVCPPGEKGGVRADCFDPPRTVQGSANGRRGARDRGAGGGFRYQDIHDIENENPNWAGVASTPRPRSLWSGRGRRVGTCPTAPKRRTGVHVSQRHPTQRDARRTRPVR